MPSSFSPDESPQLGHSPAMRSQASEIAPAPELVEDLLSNWFDAPTLLFSSARAACHVFLAEMGFHPYRQTITVPKFLSRCILNALTLNAFPTHQAGGDALLYYHQYGYRLRSDAREPLVIEDACHAFFSRAESGARSWRGQVALISLPKFFSTHGPAGALIVFDLKLLDRIQARRDSSDQIDPALASWRREVIIDASVSGEGSPVHRLLESAYALLTEYPKVDPQTLSGFPGTLTALSAIGAARRERLELFAEELAEAFPHFMFEHGLDDLPYALPFFGSGDRSVLENIDSALSHLGLHCGIYSLDVARSSYDPEYRHCVLMPCHQDLPLEQIREISSIIRKETNRR